MKFVTATLGALFCAASAAAHGGVLSYNIDGTNYVGFKPYNTPTGQSTIQRVWNKYDPIQDVTLATIACNDDGTSVPTQLTATVAAGKKVVGYWNVPWPHDTGPMLAYLGQCPSTGCTGVSPNSLQWFKIAHEGLLSGTVEKGSWAAGAMIANNNSWAVTIPSTVPQGYYLLRMETIALHSQPAQNYPECAQLFISPGGNVPPASSILVTFPGAYKQTDPGLAIDIYGQAAKTQTTYPIPGPSLYPGTGATSTSSSSTTTTTTRTSTSTTPTTSTGTSTSTANQPVATKYQQCGGSGYTGPTQCIAGTTCTVLNQFYSQCL